MRGRQFLDRDERLPHRWPGLPADGDPECIAWRCAACGYWVSELRSYAEQPECSVDWRAERRAEALAKARDALLRALAAVWSGADYEDTDAVLDQLDDLGYRVVAK